MGRFRVRERILRDAGVGSRSGSVWFGVAGVAELADAQCSERCERKLVRVRVSPSAWGLFSRVRICRVRIGSLRIDRVRIDRVHSREWRNWQTR